MPITEREKRLIDNYITSIPEYDDIDEDDIDYQLDLQYDLFRESEMEYERENQQEHQ